MVLSPNVELWLFLIYLVFCKPVMVTSTVTVELQYVLCSIHHESSWSQSQQSSGKGRATWTSISGSQPSNTTIHRFTSMIKLNSPVNLILNLASNSKGEYCSTCCTGLSVNAQYSKALYTTVLATLKTQSKAFRGVTYNPQSLEWNPQHARLKILSKSMRVHTETISLSLRRKAVFKC